MNKSKNKTSKIVIVGAGGFGREVLWTLLDCNKISKKYEILGFIDDNKSLKGKIVNKVPVLGDTDWLLSNLPRVSCVVAIGDCKIRKKIVEKLEKSDLKFPTIIHPAALCSEFVDVGKGTIIQSGSIVSMDIKIGNHAYVNFSCTIGHDCVINDFATLSPGVHISGTNTIEEGVFIGTGTVTKQNITIGRWSFIGGGTVVGKNIPEFSMYFGVPGKMKKFPK